jgi:hypothetical protein
MGKMEKKIFQFVIFGVTLLPISLNLFINFFNSEITLE